MEDPKTAKGVVKREVVQLITPGTVMDGKGLNENENNFIASVSSFQNGYGLALSDLSTGENMAAFIERLDEVVSEIYSVGAKEIVVSKQLDEETVKTLKERCQATISYEDSAELIDEAERLVAHLDEHLKIAFLTLYAYLRRTQKGVLIIFSKFKCFSLNKR